MVECGASAGEEVPVGEAAVPVTPKGAGGRGQLAATQRGQWAALRRGPMILLRQVGSARRGALVLVLRSAERFQRLVGSDELWLNLGPRAGAMRSRTHEVRTVR